MSDGHQEHPIIKRVKKIKKAGHHGGAWKIAYADFVTAMMAFFLIMWILALLNKSQLKSISEYFKDPKKRALVSIGSTQHKDADDKRFYPILGFSKGASNDTVPIRDKELNSSPTKNNLKEVNVAQEKNTKESKEKSKQQVQVSKPVTAQTTQVNVQEKMTPAEQKILTDAKQTTISAQEVKSMESMKNKLEDDIQKNPQLQQFKNNLNFQVTADGLKITLKDLENQPMFTTGQTDFSNYAGPLLNWLSHELNAYPNQVQIIGHTDTVPYNGNEYSNWELSADRANTTRRTLIKYGMDPNKIISIVGRGDMDLLNKKYGEDPANRRIEIIILTNDAKNRINRN